MTPVFKPFTVFIVVFNFIGYKISDFGELKIPLTDSENHNFIASDTSVKNSLECGLVAQKVRVFFFHHNLSRTYFILYAATGYLYFMI